MHCVQQRTVSRMTISKSELEYDIETVERKIDVIQYAIDHGKNIEVPANERTDRIVIEISNASLPYMLANVKDELQHLVKKRREMYGSE